MNDESPYKIYVNVDVEFMKDGRLIPKVIHWDDDRSYEIQKITDVRRAASLVAGATGIRYTKRQLEGIFSRRNIRENTPMSDTLTSAIPFAMKL